MLRLLATLSLSLLLLLALAWPLGVTGVTFRATGGGAARSVSLAYGSIWFSTYSSAPPAFDRPSYRVALEPPFSEVPKPGAIVPMGSSLYRVRLLWPTLTAAAFFAASASFLILRHHRRRRRGLCPACAYPKPAVEAPCPECGSPPREARLRARAVFTAIPRDAAVLALLGAAAFPLAAYGITLAERRSIAHDRALSMDPSWYAEVTAPRLTGGLTVASPDTYPGAIISGASILVLLPGRYESPGARQRVQSPQFSDRWLIGAGPDKTVLLTRLSTAERVRFESLAFDCDNDPFLDARTSATAAFLRCRFFNFNSGSGGSNALYAQDCAFLFDGCEFEGMSGRRRSFGSEALDLRGDARLLLRNSHFIDTEYIARGFTGLIDRCTVTLSGGATSVRFIAPYTGDHLQREFTIPEGRRAPLPSSGAVVTETLDDVDPLRRLLAGGGTAAYTDERIRRLAVDLGLARDPAFWRRLLFSPNAEVRDLAAQATRAPLPAMPPLEEALRQLNQAVIPLPAAAAILANPEKARTALTPIAAGADGSSPQARLNAQGLLQLIEQGAPLADLLRADAARPAPPSAPAPTTPTRPAPRAGGKSPSR